ncbi:MAG: hypothetical protein QNJ72_30760 [Pleurocapsa sp. MO_226.B13]|nr:hypothetical protein [Pleurocapsa sp. MO_226.B13]
MKGLGYGQPLEQSYKFGCNAIQLQISDNSNFRSTLSEEERKFTVASTIERVVIPEHLKPVLKIKPNLASNVDKSTYDVSKNLLPSLKLDIQSYIDKALEKENAFRQDRERFRESPNDNTIRLRKQQTPCWKSIKVITTSVATLIMTVTGLIVVLKKPTLVAGEWTTKDFNKDRDTKITLSQNQNSPTRISGTYKDQEDDNYSVGRLNGELENLHLEGYWVESHSNEKCKSEVDGSPYWGKMEINVTSTISLPNFSSRKLPHAHEKLGMKANEDCDKLCHNFAARRANYSIIMPRDFEQKNGYNAEKMTMIWCKN